MLTGLQVQTGSFIIRLATFVKGGFFPGHIYASLPEKAPNFVQWSDAVSAHPSVTSIYDERKIIEATKARIAKFAAAKN